MKTQTASLQGRRESHLLLKAPTHMLFLSNQTSLGSRDPRHSYLL